MNITLICVGKIKESYLEQGIDSYIKELSKKSSIKMIELPDEKTPDGASEAVENAIKEKEGNKILSRIIKEDYVIALCIEGRQITTDQLSSLLYKQGADNRQNIVCIIGGSLGLHESVIKRADYKLSFSKMTFPHQMMRYILLEQLSKAV